LKDSSLAVSLGLAAIDGLTCAFIAILILALILIGAGTSPGANDTDSSEILMVHVARDGNFQGGIDLHLLLDVTINGQPKPLAFEVESAGRIVKLDQLQTYVRPGGEVWWKDCQSANGNECLAEMFVTKFRRGEGDWRIRLRVADAADSFTAGPVSYKLWVQNGTSPRVENLVLSPDQPLVMCVNWTAKTVQAPCP
jgi:hypothetical protein